MIWKPMATAPKDGTLILAWNKNWGVPIAVRWQKGSKAPWRSEVGCIFFSKNSFHFWRENIEGPLEELARINNSRNPQVIKAGQLNLSDKRKGYHEQG